jgi:threonine dehydrogenase-like Zn-dependent dehydrogenase
MKAAVFHCPGDIRLEDVEKPVIGSDEVLVSPRSVGICGSDNHIFAGHWKVETPLILGHEFTGDVIESGSQVRDFKPGDRVVIEPAITCGKCYYCNSLDTNNYFCENRPTIGFTRDGAFAEYVMVPEKGLHHLPDDLDYERGAFVEPLACAVRGSDRSDVQSGDYVVILGAGPIGLLLLMLTRLRGASRIVISEINKSRRDMAKKLGSDLALNPGELDVYAASKELFHGREADVVIEAVGSRETVEQAFTLTRPGGRVCIVGLCPQGTPVTIGSSCSPRGTFERAIRLLESRRIDVAPFVTHRFALDDIGQAFADIGAGDEPAVKVMINP